MDLITKIIDAMISIFVFIYILFIFIAITLLPTMMIITFIWIIIKVIEILI